VERYRSARDLPPEWEHLAPTDAVGLERGHLLAAERAGLNDAEPWYLLARRGERAVGIGHLFLLDMQLARLGGEITPPVRRALEGWLPGFMQLRVVECGHLTAIGPGLHATGPLEGVHLRAMAAEVEAVGRERGGDVAILRDVPFDERGPWEALEADGWQPVLGFPRAAMRLTHADFDAYLTALKHKKRLIFRHSMQRLERGGARLVEIPRFGEHAPRLAELWGQVHERASDYEHELLNEDWFRAIDSELPERSTLLAVERGGRIEGYFLILLGDDELFAAHCGLDYEHNGELHSYFNLYLGALRMAWERGLERVSFGITTYGPKHGLGCRSEPLVYYVKHVRDPGLTQAFAELLRRGIRQPVNRSRPFGASTPQPRSLANDARALAPDPGDDSFRQAHSATRIDLLRLMGLYSFCPPFDGAQEPVIEQEGRPVVMLGTNSYLGLSTDPRLQRAAADAIHRCGTSCSGSPLLNGTTVAHQALERELAAFLGKERALLYSTGYQGNLGVLFGLLNYNDTVLLDARSHASLVDGARLSGARLRTYDHLDMGHLETRLIQESKRPTIIATDGLFSMEGVLAPLPAIVALARRYGARVLVDDAHGIGTIGPGGRGSCELLGVLDAVDLITGTFSKSLAAVGGFVAGPATVLDHLRHESRPHVFSASLPPSVIATVREALAVVRDEPERREALRHNAEHLAAGLRALGYQVRGHGTPILALETGDELLTLGLHHTLMERGVYTNPVLSPAVPKGCEQLRLSVMATHTPEQIHQALAVFAAVRCRDFPPPSTTQGCAP